VGKGTWLVISGECSRFVTKRRCGEANICVAPMQTCPSSLGI
jgi:hypothetical protein